MINRYTGSFFDSIAQSYGMRAVRVSYNGSEISPRPLMSHNGSTPISSMTFQNSDTEIMDQWTASIPRATLVASLGQQWEAAIAPNQAWQILDENSGKTTWKRYQTHGQPEFGNSDASDRINLVFVAGFEGNESLGFESPYLPG